MFERKAGQESRAAFGGLQIRPRDGRLPRPRPGRYPSTPGQDSGARRPSSGPVRSRGKIRPLHRPGVLIRRTNIPAENARRDHLDAARCIFASGSSAAAKSILSIASFACCSRGASGSSVSRVGDGLGRSCALRLCARRDRGHGHPDGHHQHERPSRACHVCAGFIWMISLACPNLARA